MADTTTTIKYVGETAITELIAKVKKAVADLDSAKVDKVSGKGLSTNDYTTNEKNKLSGIASGAQVNVIEGIKLNKSGTATALTPTDKVVTIDVSDKVTAAQVKAYNDLTNYYTKSNTYTKTEVNNLIGNLKTIQFSVVETLPSTGESNVIYLVLHINHSDDTNVATGAKNVYDEYIWLGPGMKYEKIGTTDIDLSDYLKWEESGLYRLAYDQGGFSIEMLDNDDKTVQGYYFYDSDTTGFGFIITNQNGDEVSFRTGGFDFTPHGGTATTIAYSDIETKSHASSTYVPKTTTVNGHALSSNITVSASDVGAYTDDEVDSKLEGYVPKTRTVNGKALSSNISLSASDVGATTMTAVENKGYLRSSNLTAMTTTEVDTLWANTAAAS